MGDSDVEEYLGAEGSGLNCVPSAHSYVEVLTPGTSEHDCVWRYGL